MALTLVFNVGSSSLTAKAFRDGTAVARVKANRVGVTGTEPPCIEATIGGTAMTVSTPVLTHAEAAERIVRLLRDNAMEVTRVGHRFVHGGHRITRAAEITPEVLETLRACLPLAPIHNPAAFAVIEAARRLLPATQQYVVADTAFHATIPPAVRAYALPQPYRDRFLKVGFHGLSYENVTARLRGFLGADVPRVVACHLGTGGSSCCAIRNGASLDTSMGASPLAGLVMSTRCGDIDPTVPIELATELGADETVRLLNTRSGLLGVSGLSSDIRDILREVAEDGPHRAECQLAFDVYVRQLVKTVGGLIAELGGIDALVFTDQVGLEVWQVRDALCRQLAFLGVHLDAARNAAATGAVLERISAETSAVAVYLVPNDEELVIYEKGCELFAHAK